MRAALCGNDADFAALKGSLNGKPVKGAVVSVVIPLQYLRTHAAYARRDRDGALADAARPGRPRARAVRARRVSGAGAHGPDRKRPCRAAQIQGLALADHPGLKPAQDALRQELGDVPVERLAQWIIQDVPELRIVDDELWQAAKERQQDRKADWKADTLAFWDRKQPRYVFSGLMTCGACGGGLEWRFWSNWSAKVEYLYYNLGTTGGTVVTDNGTPSAAVDWPSGASTRASFDGHIVRVGVNYLFNWYP